MSDPKSVHVSVLPREVIEWLAPANGKVLVDGTLGGAGHTRALAELVGPDGMVIAMDRDERAIDAAVETLQGMPIQVVQSNFCEMPEVLDACGIDKVDGVLLDLGLSSDQLADDSRGFSFSAEGPLDLRFDTSSGEAAWQMLQWMRPENLADIIYQFGEERYSRRIARKIAERREESPIRTAAELADLVRSCVPKVRGGHQIDPATRTFQALRIAVNEELKSLEIALRRVPERLKPGGRFAIISFHSLEDRRVKHAFRDDPRLEILTKKPIIPQDDEIEGNPRARSAKFRVAERV